MSIYFNLGQSSLESIRSPASFSGLLLQDRLSKIYETLVRSSVQSGTEAEAHLNWALDELGLLQSDISGRSAVIHLIKQIGVASFNNMLTVSPFRSDKSTHEPHPGVFYVRTCPHRVSAVIPSANPIAFGDPRYSSEDSDSSSESSSDDAFEFASDDSSSDDRPVLKETKTLYAPDDNDSEYESDESESASGKSSPASFESTEESEEESSVASVRSNRSSISEAESPSAVSESGGFNDYIASIEVKHPSILGVFKIGHKRIQIEMLFRHIATMLKLENHMIVPVPCAIQEDEKLYEGIQEDDDEDDDIENGLEEELWNNNLKVFHKTEDVTRSSKKGYMGVLESFAADPKQEISLIDFARMTLLAVALGLRDAKQDGYVGSTLVDLEYGMFPYLEVPEGKSLYNTRSSLHVPYLFESSQGKKILSEEDRKALLELVNFWTDHLIRHLEIHLKNQKINYVDEKAEHLPVNNSFEDLFGMRGEILASGNKQDTSDSIPRDMIETGDAVLTPEQVEACIKRITLMRTFIQENVNNTYSIEDLVRYVDPILDAQVEVVSNKEVMKQISPQASKKYRSFSPSDVGRFSYFSEETPESPVVTSLIDAFNSGRRSASSRASCTITPPARTGCPENDMSLTSPGSAGATSSNDSTSTVFAVEGSPSASGIVSPVSESLTLESGSTVRIKAAVSFKNSLEFSNSNTPNT